MEHCGRCDCNSDWKCHRRRILYRLFCSGEILTKYQFERFYREKQGCKCRPCDWCPAALGSVLMSVSQIIINSQMAEYGDMAIAAMGVAMKVVTITGMVCMGLGQGVQPILGYCVGAKLWDRFKKVLRFSLVFAFLLSAVLTGICYLFTNQIVSAFLTDTTAFGYAVQFSRILLTTSFLFEVFYVLTNAL